MSRHEQVEKRVSKLIEEVEREFSDLGEEARWIVVRAFIHQAVHHGTQEHGVEFCTLATYLSEMVGHAHKLSHSDDPKSASHRDGLH